MTNVLIQILSFVFALGVIIVVHEAGHLLVAKAFDVRVLTFSVGFGRKLWSTQRGETEYRVSAIPLGGYVRLGGESIEEATGNDPREFLSKPRWQRILVYLAGPAMNVILAIAIFAGLFMVGIEAGNPTTMPSVIGVIEPGSSGAAAGFQKGDVILAVAGKPVENWMQVIIELTTRGGKPVPIKFKRDKQVMEATVTPTPDPRDGNGDTAGLYPVIRPQVSMVESGKPAEKAGFRTGDELRAVAGHPVLDRDSFIKAIEARPGLPTDILLSREGKLLTLVVTPDRVGKVGKIGLGVGMYQRYGPARAVVEAVRYNVQIVRDTFYILGKIFKREVSAKSALSGPLGIAEQTAQAARMGPKYLLSIMGLLSISIAVMNLLPIPILDGGQISILLIEEVIRRDLPLRMKEVISQVGFVMILLLMFAVIYFDLSKKEFVRNLLSGS